MPSIAFIKDHGPVILTCSDHAGGSKKMMIHPARLPNHILPAKHPDQLSYAVIQSRTIKPMRNTQYSTQYQMHEQKGTFNGIDTFGLTNFRRFDFTSKLLAESEARAIKNRPDINALLTQLVKEKVFGESVANARREEAEELTRGINFEKYKFGSTYVPFEAAMGFLKENDPQDITVLCDDGGNDQWACNRHFQKCWPTFLYPCQQMDSFGARFPPVPNLKTPRNHDISEEEKMILWTLICLLSRIEKLWLLTQNCNLKTSQWHGWLLVYITSQCFSNISLRQAHRDPFRKIKVSSVKKIINRIRYAGLDLKEIFSDIESVFCANCDVNDASFQSLLEDLDPGLHEVAILYNLDSTIIDMFQSFNAHDQEYELRVAVSCWHTQNNWDGYVYSRHGGRQHSSWWFYSKGDLIARHSSDPVFSDCDREKLLTLVYVRSDTPNVEATKGDFMTYLGGKKNVFCHRHRQPLICSVERKLKCNCGKKEFYRCSHFQCSCCICRSCIDNLDPDVSNFIKNSGMQHDEESESIEIASDEGSSDNYSSINNAESSSISSTCSSLMEPYAEVDSDNNELDSSDDMDANDDDSFLAFVNIENEHIISEDNFDDFVTRTDEPHIMSNDEDIDYTIPTTDAGEVAVTIREEGDEKALRVSGHVILNQCGTLLSRAKHEIKGSSKHKFFLQKIHATSPGNCVPLLYPENVLFPSIHPFVGGDNIAGIGGIPAPLLSPFIEKYGFCSIPQHVRTRLTTLLCELYVISFCFTFVI